MTVYIAIDICLSVLLDQALASFNLPCVICIELRSRVSWHVGTRKVADAICQPPQKARLMAM